MPQAKRYQTDETREKILLEARTCFSRNGFFETQMKDVAAAVCMSRNTLYRYFPSKVELAMAILERALHQLVQESKQYIDDPDLPKDSTALDRYIHAVEHFMSPSQASLDERFLAEFDAYFSGSRITETFKARLQKSVELEGVSFFTKLLKQGQADGSVRKDIPAQLLNVTMINACRALQQRLILRGDVLIEVNQRNRKKISKTHLAILRAGLAPTNQ